MRQFEKLQDLIRTPQKYGVRKGTRVFSMLCQIYMHGEAQTGNSGKGFKYVHTSSVIDALKRAGVSCEYFNNAPRCGASGEHVTLRKTLRREVCKKYEQHLRNCEVQDPRMLLFECEKLYISLL